MRLTATFRRRSSVSSKMHSDSAASHARHGDGRPLHYKDVSLWASHPLNKNSFPNTSQEITASQSRHCQTRRSRKHHIGDEVTFRFACLHARQAVEFFFGREVGTEEVAPARGPGASVGSCLLLSPIFASVRGDYRGEKPGLGNHELLRKGRKFSKGSNNQDQVNVIMLPSPKSRDSFVGVSSGVFYSARSPNANAYRRSHVRNRPFSNCKAVG